VDNGMKNNIVDITTDPIQQGDLLNDFSNGKPDIGAVCAFVGLVRDFNDNHNIKNLTLEHYPGMCEKKLHDIADNAFKKFDIFKTAIYHRVGTMGPNDTIVLVLVAARHRKASFHACEYIMDYLKTDAPFWKVEQDINGQEKWIEARTSDNIARAEWKE
jgi:molybdopterin synthase catalytic subunit